MGRYVKRAVHTVVLAGAMASFGLLALPVVPGAGTALSAQGVMRHLVYDEIDKVWNCLGSPFNCMTQA